MFAFESHAFADAALETLPVLEKVKAASGAIAMLCDHGAPGRMLERRYRPRIPLWLGAACADLHHLGELAEAFGTFIFAVLVEPSELTHGAFSPFERSLNESYVRILLSYKVPHEWRKVWPNQTGCICSRPSDWVVRRQKQSVFDPQLLRQLCHLILQLRNPFFLQWRWRVWCYEVEVERRNPFLMPFFM